MHSDFGMWGKMIPFVNLRLQLYIRRPLTPHPSLQGKTVREEGVRSPQNRTREGYDG